MPDFNLSPGSYNFVVPQFMQYGVSYVQSPGMSTNQPTVFFGQPDLSMGSSSGAAVYPHWPTPAMMYPHCYDNAGPMISQVCISLSFQTVHHMQGSVNYQCTVHFKSPCDCELLVAKLKVAHLCLDSQQEYFMFTCISLPYAFFYFKQVKNCQLSSFGIIF